MFRVVQKVVQILKTLYIFEEICYFFNVKKLTLFWLLPLVLLICGCETREAKMADATAMVERGETRKGLDAFMKIGDEGYEGAYQFPAFFYYTGTHSRYGDEDLSRNPDLAIETIEKSLGFAPCTDLLLSVMLSSTGAPRERDYDRILELQEEAIT